MPYIRREDRVRFDDKIHILQGLIQSPGHLNYIITKIVMMYLIENGLSYITINDVMGVLTCVQQELYRRVAIPYEDEKIATNGDVYE